MFGSVDSVLKPQFPQNGSPGSSVAPHFGQNSESFMNFTSLPQCEGFGGRLYKLNTRTAGKISLSYVTILKKLAVKNY
jgi:hypothetical protein